MTAQRHAPQGDPCAKCGKPANGHRPDHVPDADPCSCGAAYHLHRVEHAHEGDPADPCAKCFLPKAQHRARKLRKRKPPPPEWWGIDGEGQGRDVHRYTLLACVDEHGKRPRFIECEPSRSLSTVQCLEFICALPYERVFAFSFNYDLTKLLADLPDRLLYRLFHEDLRQRKGKHAARGPKPIVWKNFVLNLQRSKFTVRRCGTKRGVTVWDVFKFFGCKFTEALSNWKIGTDGELTEMARMKDARADFDKLTPEEVRAYCFSECSKLGQLAHKLTDAHEAVGLTLKNYYGAGSTASAMLKRMGIRNLRGTPPEEMKRAIAGAFFGGRFENAVIGPIPGDVWSYDISSAYPYELCFLPCMVHGSWAHTKRRAHLGRARAAIVRYSLGRAPLGCSWAPFPFRLPEGSIAFPIESGGGWVYLDEYLEGERLFPHVRFHEAYILESDCDCKPFEHIPAYYQERLRLGKEAKGIVLKLGMNSCYGKLAQSLGENPPFQSWIWAGMITSGTRAQILKMAGELSNMSQLLMVATDGIYTTERIKLPPRPLDTGTYDVANEKGVLKPLGGWEEKIVKKGIFAARPGIYFPLEPTGTELKEVRARGIGKSVLFQCWKQIADAYARGEERVRIERWTEDGEERKLARFVGAKSSIFKNADGYKRSKSYGQWITRPIEMSFNPLPKRERVSDDGVTLELRRFPQLQSLPYKRAIAVRAPEAVLLRAAEQEAIEQPDGGELVQY